MIHCLAMIMRCISFVPSPMHMIGASRYSPSPPYSGDTAAPDRPSAFICSTVFCRIAVGVVVCFCYRLDHFLDPTVDRGKQLRVVLRIDISKVRHRSHGFPLYGLIAARPRPHIGMRCIRFTMIEGAYQPSTTGPDRRWQAAKWPGSTSRIRGVSVRQRASA